MFALVALNDFKLPDIKAVKKHLEKSFSHFPELKNISSKSDAVAFVLDNIQYVASYALMPAPIPWSDLEQPCRTASWYWPEATQTFQRHKAHLLITMLASGQAVSFSRLEEHKLLTMLVASIVACSNCAGVYWNGAVVNSPKDFLNQSPAVNGALNQLPVNLWVNFQIAYGQEKGVFGLATAGLSAFERPEIEIGATNLQPPILINLVLGLTLYLITSDVVINDGETIGSSSTERILVRYEPSLWDTTRTVMRLYP